MKIISMQNNNYNQRFQALTKPEMTRTTKGVIKRAVRDAIAETHPEILTPAERRANYVRKSIHELNQRHKEALKKRRKEFGVYMQNGVVVNMRDTEREEGLRILEEFKANNSTIPNPNSVCELIPALMKCDINLINEPINDYGITPIMAFVTINPENVDKDKYNETINYLKSRPAINFNVKDLVEVPLIEMALLGENPDIIDIAIKASNSYEAIEYYPILDKICENMSSETLKKNLQENLNVKFPDIEKAFELKSMDALKMLDGQFNSPFYKK